MSSLHIYVCEQWSSTELGIYLVKKKVDADDADIGCTNCTSSDCSENCVCRYLLLHIYLTELICCTVFISKVLRSVLFMTSV